MGYSKKMSSFSANNTLLYRHGKNPGENPALFPFLLILVCGVHILFIVVPYLYFSLNHLWAEPEPIVLKVGLADLPKVENPSSRVPLPQNQDTMEENLNDVLEDIPDPLLPDNAPPPPKELPPPVPKIKPNPQQPPKPEKNPPKPVEKAVKKEYLTADQIKKSNKRVTRKNPDSPKNSRQEAARETANRQKTEALKELRQAAEGQYGTTDPGLQGILDDQENSEYENKLKNYIRPKWKQPSKIQLGGDLPAITLYLTIEGNGMISSVKFDPCGNNAMDESVRALIEVLKRTPVPVPPKKQRLIFHVTLNTKDENF